VEPCLSVAPPVNTDQMKKMSLEMALMSRKNEKLFLDLKD
jgi:hypothetical protein